MNIAKLKIESYYKYFIFILIITIVLDYFGARLYKVTREDIKRKLFIENDSMGFLHILNAEFMVPWQEAPEGCITYKTNNLGFRENSPTSIKNESDYRILVFGDSHTDGVVNNEQSFSNVAESILNHFKPELFDIINAGIGHQNLYQQYLLFKHLLYLKPDIAIFTFYTGNDYLEILDKSVFHLELEQSKIYPRPARSTVKDFLLDNSLIFRIVTRFDPRPYFRAERLKRYTLWQSLAQEYYFQKNPKDFEKAVYFHNYVLTQIKEAAKKNGVEIYFIILPSKYQIERNSDLDSFKKIEEILNLSSNEKMDDKIRLNIIQILTKDEIPCLDPYEEFIQRVSTSQPLFWNTDHHLSKEGHKFLGNLLAAYLNKMIVVN
jgi:lysophospholipase L1-like esterase